MKSTKWMLLLLILVLSVFLAGCGGSSTPAPAAPQAAKKIVVGFSQVGAESEWRIAMSKILSGLTAAGRHAPLLLCVGPNWGEMAFSGSPADFARLIADQTESWGRAVKSSRVKGSWTR